MEPGRELVAASRLLLGEIEQRISRRENFAFETTLAVNKALDRKKRLGQYAVVWKDGKSVMLGKELKSKKPA